MAVEIVPKPKAKPKKIVSFLFYLSLVVLILTVGIYFSLYSLEKKEAQKLERLEGRLAQQETKEMKDLRKNLKKDEEKINDFSILLDSYRCGTDFFEFLEGITHPKVMWLNANLNLVEFKLTITGKTDGFNTLTQQLLVLEKNSKIKDLKLSSLSLVGGEEVSFGLELSLSPELFE